MQLLEAKFLFDLCIYYAIYNETTGLVDIWRDKEEAKTSTSISQDKAVANIQQLKSFNFNLDTYADTVFKPENLLDR